MDPVKAQELTQKVLSFWFGPPDQPPKLNSKLWWGGAPAVDEDIRTKFQSTVEEVGQLYRDGQLGGLLENGPGSLTAVLLLDQMPRNIWRATPKAFSFDADACEIARMAVEKGFDQQVNEVQRLFFYVCMEHSEDLKTVKQAVELIATLKYRCPEHLQRFFGSQHRNASKHFEIIKTYSRYPYRNEILGRESTPEELRYLKSGKLPTFAKRTVRAKQVIPDEPQTPKLKVLALHGFRQGRAAFKKKTTKMRTELAGHVSLVYAQAPIIYDADANEIEVVESALGGERLATSHQKVWWNASKQADGSVVYRGADTSLAYLREVVRAEGPFDGILGYAQGGCAAACLASLEPDAFRFAVFISSFPPRDETCKAMLASPLKIPSIHVWGKKDILVDPARSQALSSLFIDPVLAPHEGAHFVPNAWPYEQLRAFCDGFTPVDDGPGLARQLSIGAPPGASTSIQDLLPPGISNIATELLNHNKKITQSVIAELVEDSFGNLDGPEEVDTSIIFDGLISLSWQARRQYDETLKMLSKHAESEETLHRNPNLPPEQLVDLDFFAHLWVELYLRYPDKVLEMVEDLPRLSSWVDLNRLYLSAQHHPHDAPETEELLSKLKASIVSKVASQLKTDAENCLPQEWVAFCLQGASTKPRVDATASIGPRPSLCAFSAPRKRKLNNDMARDVAYLLNPLHVDPNDPDVDPERLKYTKGHSFERYRLLIVQLCSILQRGTTRYAEQEHARARNEHAAKTIAMHTEAAWNRLRSKEQPVSDAIINPTPEPVVPCTAEQLQPVLDWLTTGKKAEEQTAFLRGTAVPDGRLDLCKQVVGPSGIEPLMTALLLNANVTRLLLGNNIVSDSGAEVIAEHVRSGKSPLTTLYIAGNDFTVKGITPICQALEADKKVDMLWLKRNPLKPPGAIPVAKMLRVNSLIHTLDLVNTGLLDEGAITILDALDENTALRHLYLGSNGLTAKAATAFGKYFATGKSKLQTLGLSIGRIADEGAVALAQGLRHDTQLERLAIGSNRVGPVGAKAFADLLVEHQYLRLLDMGFPKATVAMGEIGNRIGDEGAVAFSTVLRANSTLRTLDFLHNGISQKGLNALREALRENSTLTNLVFNSFGVVYNDFAREEVASKLEQNRTLLAEAGEDPFEVDLPDHIAQIYSVYRTK